MGRQSISNSFTVNTVEDGENVCALDIDNEYDGVSTDASHKISAAKTVSTIVRLYDGGTEVDISNIAVNQGNGISVTGMPAPSVATFTSAAESGGFGKVLSWAFVSGQVMQASYSILITLTYNGTPYSATFTIVASEGGTSTYMADLDNEMDAIACSNVGTPLIDPHQDVSTTVSMWYGSSSLTMSISVYDYANGQIGNQYSNGHSYINSQGISVAWDNAGKITARFRKQYNSADVKLPEKKVFYIKIESTKISGTGSIIKDLYFTVNCMRGAAVYQLVPSVNKIIKHSNNTSTPLAAEYITCVVTKLMGGVTVTAPASEYSLTYSLDGGTTESAYTQTGVRVGLVTSNLIFILKVPNSSGILADKETIPVITDGEDGESGHDVNPNILLDTAEYKTGEYNSSTNPNGKWFHLNGVNSGEFEGRVARLVTINNTNGEGSTYRRVAEQQIATSPSNLKLQANTWYTFSAYFKRWGSANYASMSLLDATGYIDSTFERDGEKGTNYSSGDLTYTISINDTWTRHTLTFKTKADMSSATTPMYVSTRHLGTVGGVYVAMMKLEQGKYATAYMANEDDLKGADGANGKDAAVVIVAPSPILYSASSNGSASVAQTIDVSYSLHVGNNECTVSSASNVTIEKPSNMGIQNKGAYSCQLTIAKNVIPNDSCVGFTITGTYGGKSYTATTYVSIAGIKAGADGSRGKTGRAYYYAGEWDELASSFSVVVNDAQAPFFGYKPSGSTHGYYVLVRDQNGTFTKEQIYSNCGNPVAQNENWSKMADDQEYIITKAIFGDYAQFGGAIINKDWLTSVYGDIYIGWQRGTIVNTTTSSPLGGDHATWICKFWARQSGTHKLTIKCTTNGSSVVVGLFKQTSQTSGFDLFQPASMSDTETTFNVTLDANGQYILYAYKSGSNNPIVDYAKLNTSNNHNYLYLDPLTASGNKTPIFRGNLTLSTSLSSPTVIVDNLDLYEYTSYVFYITAKCSTASSKTVTLYLDKYNGSSWDNINWTTLSFNKTQFEEKSANWAIGAGSSGTYRLKAYSDAYVYVGAASISAGAMFAPAFGVDLYRGVTSINNVTVRGVINAQLFYSSTKKVTQYDETDSGSNNIFYYNVNLETEPYYMYYVPDRGKNHVLYLPDPSNYDGVELRFFRPILDGSNHGFVAVSYSGGIYRLVNGTMQKTTGSTDWLVLKPNKFATFKSMDANWWSMDDGVEAPDSSVPSIDPENPEIDEQE